MKAKTNYIAAILALGALLLVTVVPTVTVNVTRPSITVSSNLITGGNGTRPIVK